MGKLPAYGRELLEMRRFGNRRPKFDAVFLTDWWDVARDIREKLGYCALVIEPFDRYNLGCCADLHVILLMRGDRQLALRALRTARPSRVSILTAEQYLDWLEWIVAKRTTVEPFNGQ